MQLQIKAATANNYDTQALGLLAFAAAAGAAIAGSASAAHHPARGWWIPLIGLAGAIVLCLRELLVGRPVVGRKLELIVKEVSGKTEESINEALLDHLLGALAQLDGLLERKTERVTASVVWLGIAAISGTVVLMAASG